MSHRGSLALLPRTRKGLVFFWTALFMLSMALQYAAAASPKAALATDECQSFAIFTTDVDGTNNENHYASKPEVYLNGGPGPSGQLAEGTIIYYRVEEPDGTPLSEIRQTTVDADGQFFVQLYPFDTTTNPGNEYSVTASQLPTLEQGSCTKNDNFKVDGPGSLKIIKHIDGAQNVSGSFDIHVDCGLAGSFDRTIVFPDPGFVTISGIDALAHCTVTETSKSAAPAGYAWDAETIDGSPATIKSDGTVDVTITNHLHVVPNPALSVTKGVSLSADGPFNASLTTGIGTTVYYRITITNTGNVALSGVTLSDDKFNLVDKGCAIPTTLAVGAHYDCNYSTSAVAGTTTNTATGDSAETPPDSDTATVIGTTSPGFTVTKGVGLSAAGPFIASRTVQTGTTVFYRITITNTGNVPLTGVTLSDDHFNLGTKGCAIPATLAVGAHYDCNYSDTAVTGTTTNIATGDTAETAPDTDTATVVATVTPPPPSLRIDKSNNAPIASTGLPTAAEGSTVTYTLHYTSQNGSVHNGVITDVLPTGLTYVPRSATGNGEFTFAGYDAGTRTLTWNAATVTTSGSVTYQARVNAGAAGIPQPLENRATVDSDETGPDTDVSDVFVAVPPLAETSVPTAPRTDVLTSGGTSAPGMNLGLVLLALAGLAFALVFVTPVPATMRNRIRRR